MYEKFAQITLLYDFYGNLLTEKQQEILTLYYEDNLSLGEIGEDFSISRQAVYDNLKRAEKILVGYEAKLGLVKKFEANKVALLEIADICREVKQSQELNKMDIIIDKVSQMID